ncbi:MAG TPA: M56 family metallopeptidase [Cyclobacteriaceae bacterium]|nr:M56 family metallopeptidase [Cyclobacteriaceae bacterium]
MNYIIEANLGFVFFYGVYCLFMRNETDFTKQRVFLLMGLVCSVLFPLMHFETGIAENVLAQTAVLPEFTVNQIASEAVSATQIIFLIYLVVAVIIATPLLLHSIKIYHTIKSRGTRSGNFRIVESNSNNPSWSFFRVIFIGQSDQLTPEEKNLIVKHEMLHGRLFHSADILLITILCLACWFNPVLWIYRRALGRVHEFEVDAIVARESNPAEYGMLLAKTVLSGNGFLLTHHFNQSFILKRINMLNVITRRVSNWKIAGLATTIVLYLALVSCTEQLSEQEKPGEVFTVADESAMPVEGIQKFYEQLGGKLYYPEKARKMGIEGKVFVEFIVQKDGSLTDFKILKSVSDECDAEAMRALGKMEPWVPAKMNGNAVAQRMVLPVNFKLN